MKTKPHKILGVVIIIAVASAVTVLFSHRQTQTTRTGVNAGRINRESEANQLGSALHPSLASLPISFEANRGQADADVRFVGRGNGIALLLKPGEAVLGLRKREQRVEKSNQESLAPNEEAAVTHRLSMILEGAASTAQITGVDLQPARANYYIGNDPAKWITNVDTYARVSYSKVYPGVDLVFYGNDRQLEYDFTVSPGADPGQIKLRFGGIDGSDLTAEGDLVLHSAAGDVRHNRPVAYQQINGSRHQIAADFRKLADGAIAFEVGDYDQALPLVIDPALVYSTYVGGSVADVGRGIVADSTGTAIILGDSFSSDFLFSASITNSDIFVGKLSADGLLLTYTFFGGTKNETATGLTTDAAGNLYLCGTTESPDFPQLNSFGSALLGPSDAFVIKLAVLPNQPLVFEYSSLIGGSGEELGPSIAVGGGNAYLTGRTSSLDFPLAGPIQAVYGGGDTDAFVTKFASDGKTLVYSSYLGGSGTEDLIRRTGISVDGSGNAYVTGDTQSTNFPTKNALRSSKTGAAATFDGYVAKINPAGTDFVYSTYLGGADDDFGLAIATDSTGNAYVAGRTRSTSFTGSTSTRPATGTTDAFVGKLNATGSAITYLTFVGGNNGDESANAIVIDSLGNAVIAGTAGDGFPTVNAIQSFFKGGANDVFVAKLGPNGAVTFSTYLGGSGDEAAFGVNLDAAGLIYITGFTDSEDFVTVSPLRFANAGGRDIIIAKIDPNATPNRPILLQAAVSGKNLLVFGQNFDQGAVLLINDEATKTRNEDPAPDQILFAKKAAKRIASGQVVQLQVENPNGKRSNFLFFRKP